MSRLQLHSQTRLRVLVALHAAAILVSAAALAQDSAPATKPARGTKLLTFEMVHGPDRVDFGGRGGRGAKRWHSEAGYYLEERDGRRMKVNAETEEAAPLYDDEALQKAILEGIAGIKEDDAKRLARDPAQFSKDRGTVMIRHDGAIYACKLAEGKLHKVIDRDGGMKELALSPGGGLVHYVKDNDLYAADTAGGPPRRITRDGSETILNGILDWVYQEEVYGRGTWRAYWVRPDDAYTAFLRLDEKDVPIYTLIDPIPYRQKPEQDRYPKAGDPNPTVRLRVAARAEGEPIDVDLSKYKDDQPLVVRVGWAPDGKLIYQVQNREQTWLDLNEADPRTGAARTLFRETSPAWVNVLIEPHWLPDGSFLWISERDGYAHLYHYARDGALLRRLTEGEWEVRTLHGVDGEAGYVYFSGTKDTPTQQNAYRVPLKGGEVQRLTEPGFSHSASFDAGCRLFFDTFSNIHTPPRVGLRRGDGSLLRAVNDNDKTTIHEYKLGETSFVMIPARDGHMLSAMIIKPADFEPGKRYPVWIPVYAGPAAPTVDNRWSGNGYMAHQLLAQQGILVMEIDPRSAAGMGAKHAWTAYKRLGEQELADIEDGVKWLIEQGWADPERVGITGFSYGGFMACYALTHSTMFSVGVAGGSVTDWRNYDTIYTERYMMTPQNNPEGYQRTSCVENADKLHGRLLLVHGLMDDNVHVQNTLQLMLKLQDAGRKFDVMLYPSDRHGIGRGGRHFQRMVYEFVIENL